MANRPPDPAPPDPPPSGPNIVDVMALPDGQQQLVTWMMRQGEVSLSDAAAHTHTDAAAVGALLDILVEKGFVEGVPAADERRYRVHLAPKRGHRLPPSIWKALEE